MIGICIIPGAEALLHPASHIRATRSVPLPGHIVRPVAQPKTVVEVEERTGDIPPHGKMAAGAGTAADVGTSAGR